MSDDRILVLGSSRSGSIWTARMLASSPGGQCVVEPDNVNTARHATSSAFRSFPVLTPGTDSPEYEALWRMAFAGRVPGRDGLLHPLSSLILRSPSPVRRRLLSASARALNALPGVATTVVVQTVMAHFAAEWIVDTFSPRVVIIQRNPLNMISSWLEWNVSGHDLATRPEVRARCERLGISLPPLPTSDVGRIAWYVGVLTATLGALALAHPDWEVVTHEVLCAGPDREFRDLFSSLGLPWTEEAERFLEETGYLVPRGRTHHGRGPSRGSAASVRAQVAQKWRERMTPDHVAEADEVLAAFPNAGWVSVPASARAGRAV